MFALPPNPGNQVSPYFENSHVFLLAGHGEDTGGIRYELKENEFYATPTRCGRLGIMETIKYMNFVRHNPQIKIPTRGNDSSLYPLNYEDFPFRESSSIMNVANERGQRLYLNQTNTQHEFKIYYPFSSKSHTKSIPNVLFYYFSHFLIGRSRYTGPAISFNYGGSIDTINPGEYILFQITFSGALNPNSYNQEFVTGYNDRLMPLSNQLVQLFGVTANMYSNSLLFFIPTEEYETVLYNSDKSYYKYLRELLNLFSLLSIIKYTELIDIRADTRLIDVLNMKINIQIIYEKLREQVRDNKPIFIINPLCRQLVAAARPREHRLSNNSNVEMNIRGTINRGQRSRYATKRRITRKKVMHNAFKRLINNVYTNGIKKGNLKEPELANLSGITNTRAWRNYIDHIGFENSDILNDTTMRLAELEMEDYLKL